MALLRKRQASALSQWIFHHPLKSEQPVNAGSAYHRLKVLLKKGGLPDIRFHDLRHTFASVALEQGMDIKTLSMIIGHVSAHTTLNVYAHVTDNMRKSAAAKIDKGIGGGTGEQPEELRSPPKTDFQPTRGKYRKKGTGCISRIGENLWEGRYSPRKDGKRIIKTVYAHTEDECEALLAGLIAQMKSPA